MHPLSHYLLETETPTIEGLIAQTGDEVEPKEATNVIQFCFMKLAEDHKQNEFKNPEDEHNVLKKLLRILSKHKSEFTTPSHIATIFYCLGEVTYNSEDNQQLVQLKQGLLKKLLIAANKNSELLNEKAISTLFCGLGNLKSNNAFTAEEDWEHIAFQNILLNIINKLLTIKPSAKALATTIFAVSKLKISSWTDENKEILNKLLTCAIVAFIDLQETSREDNNKPKAQEISNFLYAIAKLAKHGALIPLSWQAEECQEKILYPLVRLIYKKTPTEHAISQIFYALGKLGEGNCLKAASIFWLIKPIIRYQLAEKVDHRTAINIFTALGRLASGKFLQKNDWLKDEDLLEKLLVNADFTDPHDIADFFLGIGRLADAGIMTKDLWGKYKEKFSTLMTRFTACNNIDRIYKSAYFAGMQKLQQQGFDVITNPIAENFNRSASNSPIMRSVLNVEYSDKLEPGDNEVVAGSVQEFKNS